MSSAVFVMGIAGISSAYAQDQGVAQTNIMTPVTVTNVNDLNFGRIIPGNVRSVIRIDRDNGSLDIRSGDALPVGGTVDRAEFVINAEPLTRVQITLPTRLNIVRNGGSETMRVNRFRLDGRGARRVNRNIDNSGKLSILVSAQILVLPTQAAGIYNANYDVTVEYN